MCPSCKTLNLSRLGGIAATDVFAGRSLSRPLLGGELFRCNDCRLYFRHPRLSKEELDGLYRLGQANNWEDHLSNRNDWRIAADWIRQEGKGRKILDIGCYDGGFLDSLGKDYERFGIEIHESAAERARGRGIDIIGADYSDLAEIADKFDVVVAMDVIEHVPDPKYFLALLKKVLKPGGRMIVSTGNTQAPSWRWMGSRYWYCTFAEHISFISPEWCYLVAKQTDLAVIRIHRFSHSVSNRKRQLEELAKNLVYKLAPGFMSWLRLNGFGGKDARKHAALAHHPPPWPSAKDHFLALFQKSTN